MEKELDTTLKNQCALSKVYPMTRASVSNETWKKAREIKTIYFFSSLDNLKKFAIAIHRHRRKCKSGGRLKFGLKSIEMGERVSKSFAGTSYGKYSEAGGTKYTRYYV